MPRIAAQTRNPACSSLPPVFLDVFEVSRGVRGFVDAQFINTNPAQPSGQSFLFLVTSFASVRGIIFDDFHQPCTKTVDSAKVRPGTVHIV
jgi:hypothetical protein